MKRALFSQNNSGVLLCAADVLSGAARPLVTRSASSTIVRSLATQVVAPKERKPPQPWGVENPQWLKDEIAQDEQMQVTEVQVQEQATTEPVRVAALRLSAAL